MNGGEITAKNATFTGRVRNSRLFKDEKASNESHESLEKINPTRDESRDSQERAVAMRDRKDFDYNPIPMLVDAKIAV